MNINPRHITSKKLIGKLKNDNVWRISTVGGLHLVVIAKAKPEIAAMGSHPGLSQFIAEKKYPDMEFVELSKGNHDDPECFGEELAKYQSISDLIAKIQNNQ